MARPGIMLYFDILEPIRVLPDSDKGRLLVAMLEYGQDGIVPKFDGMLALAWGFVKPKIDRDNEEYKRSVLRRQYATVCRERKRKGEPEISFEEWVRTNNHHDAPLMTNDDQWHPTTTATTSTTTKSTASTTAAVAVTETTDDSAATATTDRKLKMLQGELGKGVVALTDHQIDVLLDKMGLEMFDHYVVKLSDFIIKTGAQVKSHYATILKWWMEDSQDDNMKG